jgi:hypothetical protein
VYLFTASSASVTTGSALVHTHVLTGYIHIKIKNYISPVGCRCGGGSWVSGYMGCAAREILGTDFLVAHATSKQSYLYRL